jgi:hypothetical protein
VADVNCTLTSRAFEDWGAIAADDSSGEFVFLQGEGERSAYETGTDNRDLANGHRSWKLIQATVRPTAGAMMRN